MNVPPPNPLIDSNYNYPHQDDITDTQFQRNNIRKLQNQYKITTTIIILLTIIITITLIIILTLMDTNISLDTVFSLIILVTKCLLLININLHTVHQQIFKIHQI